MSWNLRVLRVDYGYQVRGGKRLYTVESTKNRIKLLRERKEKSKWYKHTHKDFVYITERVILL